MRKRRKYKSYIIEVNFAQRAIMIDGFIGKTIGEKFVRSLDKMNGISQDDILLFLSSEGGDFDTAIDMKQAIGRSKSNVTLICFDRVHSSSFFLAQARFTTRLALVGTSFRFHRVFDELDAKEIRTSMNQEFYEERLRIISLMNATQLLVFTERGAPAEVIIKMLNQEASIRVATAIELKLIDKIINKQTFDSYFQVFEKRSG